jgi:ArsR family transcriptional regulator
MDDGQLVRVLKALADAKRFRMVQEIAAAGEIGCGDLGELFSLSQPTVSHHLKILADAGVLKMRRSAQHGYLSVDHELLLAISGQLPGRLKPRKKKNVRSSRRRSSNHHSL